MKIFAFLAFYLEGVFMSYPIEKKLVIAVSSSALFDLSESHKVFLEKGRIEYKKFQEKNIDKILEKGVAFSFIKKFLDINTKLAKFKPVEVVLLSRNSASTGKRVFRSIEHYQLDISRAAFVEGKSPHKYIPAFNASLFLSANKEDIQKAIKAGYPGGFILPTQNINEDLGEELRIAFDFDGVIADDESEEVYQTKSLYEFHKHEVQLAKVAHQPGPLADLFKKLSNLQKLEDEQMLLDKNYKKILSTAIVTARNAPAHERVITTLEDWGVSADMVFFLGGMDKNRILSELKPQIFFDDQITHLKESETGFARAHIPFGKINKPTGA